MVAVELAVKRKCPPEGEHLRTPLSRGMYMGESEFDGFATAKTWL
jgi:hypothetical protein